MGLTQWGGGGGAIEAHIFWPHFFWIIILPALKFPLFVYSHIRKWVHNLDDPVDKLTLPKQKYKIKNKNKGFLARIFAQILPEMCPIFARILSEICLNSAQNITGPPPPPSHTAMRTKEEKKTADTDVHSHSRFWFTCALC